MNRTNRWNSTFYPLYPLLFGLGATFSTPLLLTAAPLEPSVAWRPTATDEFEWDRRFVEELLNRGFNDLANAELEPLETRLETASKAALLRFGATAIRAAVETSRLSSVDDRADVAKKIAGIRRQVAPALENDGAGAPISVEENEYQSALVRAYFELGVLDAESGKDATFAPETPDVPAAKAPGNNANFKLNKAESPYFVDAFEISKRLAAQPRSEAARPFVYWGARILLAQVILEQDVKSDSSVEKIGRIERFAVALEKASPTARDEFYFLAKLLRIESARIQGNVGAAAERIAETLKALETAEPELSAAFNAALVAEETRLLTLEGKTNDALKLAFGDVDLLGRSLSPSGPSQFDALFEVDDFRNFANVELFWNAAAAADATVVSNAENADSQTFNKERLIQSAQTAAAKLKSNFWKTRAARLVRDAAQNGGDWRTLEAAANENYRRNLWEAALADFDRASSEAAANGADDDAFRLAGSAAAIVDKINRDKLFETEKFTLSSPDFWRSEAVRRFDSLSRSRPDASVSPRLFLLALEYSQELPTETPETQTARRLDYLRLFPNAQNVDSFACDAARRALAVERLDDAAAFLDFVPASAPEFPAALELERQLAQIQREKSDSEFAQSVLFANFVRRLLAKTTAANGSNDAENGADDDSAANVVPVETLLLQTAQKITSDSFSSNDAKIFETIFELAFSTDSTKNETINAALETLLNRWESALSAPTNVEKSALDSFRLSLWLDAKKTDKILKYVADVERSAPDAATETLERLLNFAEKTPPETKKSIGEFVLSALDWSKTPSSNDGDSDRRDLTRARALQLSGKAQEALDLFATIRKNNPKNVAAIRGIATVLTERTEPAALERALRYWSDVAELVRVESPDWWDAKERCVEIYSRLGRKDQAAKMTKTIWLTRSDPNDPGRRERWENLCR